LVCDGSNINAGEAARQANIYAFVEKYPQAASVTARVVALQKRNHLRPRYRGKTREKLVDGIASLEILK
jgi:cytochrome c